MRAFTVLFGKELRSFFTSPVAYIVLFGSSLFIGVGVAMWLTYIVGNNVKEMTILQGLMRSFFFWVPLFVQVPIITMRAFSEEYKLGTIEMLLSAPVREWEVVLAKFAAVLAFYAILWAPVPICLSFVYLFSNQAFDYSWGMLVLPLLLVLLIGGFYISIGLLASSLTKNQIVAAILSFGFIFLAFCLGILPAVASGNVSREMVNYFSAQEHMDTFALGIADTRPFIWYLSGTVFFLFLTQRVLEGRRLRS